MIKKIDRVGLQKLSMVDFPGKTAAVLFLPGCNLRCPFCHNAGLVLEPEGEGLIGIEEAFSYLEERKGLLDGVCISGGEPLMNPLEEVMDILNRAGELGYSVKLDTNGCFPDKLSEILDSGVVDYVAMDIKNQPLKYPETVGIAGFDVRPVMRSAELLQRSGIDHEFRTTVAHPFHEVSDFSIIGKWIKDAPAYYLQRYNDSGNIIKRAGVRAFSDEEMNDALACALINVPKTGLR